MQDTPTFQTQVWYYIWFIFCAIYWKTDLYITVRSLCVFRRIANLLFISSIELQAYYCLFAYCLLPTVCPAFTKRLWADCRIKKTAGMTKIAIYLYCVPMITFWNPGTSSPAIRRIMNTDITVCISWAFVWRDVVFRCTPALKRHLVQHMRFITACRHRCVRVALGRSEGWGRHPPKGK